MPYITPLQRQLFEPFLGSLRGTLQAGGNSVGDLNYVITSLMKTFIGPTPNYARYNSAIGVIECAKLEIFRRAVGPYEDTKREENGDVE